MTAERLRRGGHLQGKGPDNGKIAKPRPRQFGGLIMSCSAASGKSKKRPDNLRMVKRRMARGTTFREIAGLAVMDGVPGRRRVLRNPDSAGSSAPFSGAPGTSLTANDII